MEGICQAKKLIQDAQNILVLAPKNPGVDNLSSALSLSYTLNNAGKIVNSFPKTIPDSYSPLFPKEIISKNFVISIKGKEISELYYEKENRILKIYLSSKENGIKKEDVEFAALEKASTQESDLLVIIGIERLEELGNFYEKNFKLFYQTPILNIDNHSLNNKFGNVNLVSENLPTSVISEKLITAFDKITDKKVKTWLLAGVIEFFQRKKINQGALESVFSLAESELDYRGIVEFFADAKRSSQTKLLSLMLKKMKFQKEQQLPFVCLTKKDFKDSDATPKDLGFALEQLAKKIFQLPSLLLIWESNLHSSFVRGVFYSLKPNESKEILRSFSGEAKGRAVIFNTKEKDIDRARERVMEII
jgi:nanoRNase/pAp phosphatase (c-di-AMP/oligoRNAs hydrolase)